MSEQAPSANPPGVVCYYQEVCPVKDIDEFSLPQILAEHDGRISADGKTCSVPSSSITKYLNGSGGEGYVDIDRSNVVAMGVFPPCNAKNVARTANYFSFEGNENTKPCLASWASDQFDLFGKEVGLPELFGTFCFLTRVFGQGVYSGYDYLALPGVKKAGVNVFCSIPASGPSIGIGDVQCVNAFMLSSSQDKTAIVTILSIACHPQSHQVLGVFQRDIHIHKVDDDIQFAIKHCAVMTPNFHRAFSSIFDFGEFAYVPKSMAKNIATLQACEHTHLHKVYADLNQVFLAAIGFVTEGLSAVPVDDIEDYKVSVIGLVQECADPGLPFEAFQENLKKINGILCRKELIADKWYTDISGNAEASSESTQAFQVALDQLATRVRGELAGQNGKKFGQFLISLESFSMELSNCNNAMPLLQRMFLVKLDECLYENEVGALERPDKAKLSSLIKAYDIIKNNIFPGLSSQEKIKVFKSVAQCLGYDGKGSKSSYVSDANIAFLQGLKRDQAITQNHDCQNIIKDMKQYESWWSRVLHNAWVWISSFWRRDKPVDPSTFKPITAAQFKTGTGGKSQIPAELAAEHNDTDHGPMPDGP